MGLIIQTTSFRTSKIIVTLIYVCLHEVGRKTGILQNVICRTETIDDDAAQQSPPLKNWPQTADRPTVVPKRLKPAKNKISWYDFTNFFQAIFSRFTLTSVSYYCSNSYKKFVKMLQDNFTNFLNGILGGFLPWDPPVWPHSKQKQLLSEENLKFLTQAKLPVIFGTISHPAN